MTTPSSSDHFPENTELAAIFNFSPDDLQANRVGRISDAQVESLKHTSDDQQFALGCLAVLPLCGCGFFVVVNSIQHLDAFNRLLFGGVFVLLTAFAVIAIFLSRRSLGRDINDRVARSITGMMRVYNKQSGRSMWYYAEVGSKSFVISVEDYNALRKYFHGNTQYPGYLKGYTAYYAPRSNKLLSLEAAGEKGDVVERK